jgi:hypothetical protein
MREKMTARTLLDFEYAIMDLFEKNRITTQDAKTVLWTLLTAITITVTPQASLITIISQVEVVTEDRTVYQVKALEEAAVEVLTMVEVATQAVATNISVKPLFVRINKISMWHPSQITHSIYHPA